MRRFVTVAAAAALAACGGGGGGASPGPGVDLAGLRGTVTEQTKEDWGTLRYREKYRVQNNVWNKSSYPGAQVVFLEDIGGAPGFGWRWSWSSGSTVAASPEVIYGDKPWEPAQGIPTEFPVHPGSVDLQVDFQATLSASGTYNTAFTMWGIRDPADPLSSISHEIMVWRMRRGLVPAGTRLATVDVDGARYELWVKQDHGDSTNPQRWTYVAFMPTTDLTAAGADGSRVLSGPVRLDAFLDVLVQKGILATTDWVTSVELQNEVAGSAGTTELTGYQVTVTPRP